jgi:hypothetical protein
MSLSLHLIDPQGQLSDTDHLPVIQLRTSFLKDLSLFVMFQGIKAGLDGASEDFSFKIDGKKVLTHHELLIGEIIFPTLKAMLKGG